MNHLFLKVDDNKINNIINKLELNKKLNIVERILLKKWCFDQLYSKKNIELSDDIFCRLNNGNFLSYGGDFNKKMYGYNSRSYTLIPHSSLKFVINDLQNLTKDELKRLEEIGISKNEYENSVKELIYLIIEAQQEEKAILHLGI